MQSRIASVLASFGIWSVVFGIVPCVALAQSSATVVAQARTPDVRGDTQNLSDKEKLNFAEDASEEMREALDALEEEVVAAQDSGDADLYNCKNVMYASLSALYKVTELATITMQASIANKKSQEVDREFRKVVLALNKARQLVQQASECVGSDGVQGPGEDPTVTVEDKGLEGSGSVDDEPTEVVPPETDPRDDPIGNAPESK